jgi:hypothetical protein
MSRIRESNSVLCETTKRRYVLEIFYQCPREQNLLTRLLIQDDDNLLNKTDSFLLFAFTNAKK